MALPASCHLGLATTLLYALQRQPQHLTSNAPSKANRLKEKKQKEKSKTLTSA